MTTRRAGILLHPTSLPSRFGIGDLGPDAHRWVDALARARQSLWQVLPLGPTGFGDSPYQCFSSMAGNPYLVSPERLTEDGLLTPGELAAAPAFDGARVDFGRVIPFKLELLSRAHTRFRDPAFASSEAGRALHSEFERFAREHAHWIDDYALFMALKAEHGGRPWPEWEAGAARRAPEALGAARTRLATAIDQVRLQQFAFFRQWQAVRERAHAHGIAILGDVPIFVAHDSADVWAHRELFQLEESGRPRFVAGVPPDYFSATGQLWGNPLYRWEAHAATGYAWWIQRVRATLEQVDLLRIDHFRGFEAYWEVPAGNPTAEIGRWVKGPGLAFFAALRQALGELPIVAEDLGVITPEVEALRDSLGLPGMKVLQFAFDSTPANAFLPHHHVANAVVYTGTHDNDPTRSWYEHLPESARDYTRRYLGSDDRGIVHALMRAAMGSVADLAIVPLQDVLELGREGRMNLPGEAANNWSWRFEWEGLTEARIEGLARLARDFDRVPAPAPEATKET